MPDENDIRVALRVLAQDAPEPGTVLTAVRTAAPTSARQAGANRWRRWAAPLAAATAVGAIVAASVAIGTSGHRGGSAPATRVDIKGLPPYYFSTANDFSYAVYGTRTGALLATVHNPRGWSFVAAAPGPDNHSFLLEAGHRDQARIYLLRFHPADDSTNLTRLLIPVLPNATFAISPSGAEVAESSNSSTGAQLRVYTVDSRLIREWRESGAICPDAGPGVPCLSWTASGYLVYSWAAAKGTSGDGVWLIRVSAASGRLLRASRKVLPWKTVWIRAITNFLVSGDGTKIAIQVPVGRSGTIVYRFEAFSMSTGKLTARFWPRHGTTAEVGWWINRTGSTLIVGGPPVRVLARRGFALLPWGRTAFGGPFAF
jgi:hypothetical protein